MIVSSLELNWSHLKIKQSDHGPRLRTKHLAVAPSETGATDLMSQLKLHDVSTIEGLDAHYSDEALSDYGVHLTSLKKLVLTTDCDIVSQDRPDFFLDCLTYLRPQVQLDYLGLKIANLYQMNGNPQRTYPLSTLLDWKFTERCKETVIQFHQKTPLQVDVDVPGFYLPGCPLQTQRERTQAPTSFTVEQI